MSTLNQFQLWNPTGLGPLWDSNWTPLAVQLIVPPIFRATEGQLCVTIYRCARSSCCCVIKQEMTNEEEPRARVMDIIGSSAKKCTLKYWSCLIIACFCVIALEWLQNIFFYMFNTGENTLSQVFWPVNGVKHLDFVFRFQLTWERSCILKNQSHQVFVDTGWNGVHSISPSLHLFKNNDL